MLDDLDSVASGRDANVFAINDRRVLRRFCYGGEGMKRRSLAFGALLLLAGCSTPADPEPKPALCTSGQTTFGTASTSPLLTGVTPVLEAVTKGMTLDEPYAEVNARTAKVQASAPVPAEEIYRQLAATYAQERSRSLATYGAVHHPATGESATFDETGRFVSYEWIRTVDVPFRYSCDGVTTEGTVISWEAVGRGGVLNCAGQDAKASADEAEMIRHVRQLRCSGS